MPYAREEIYADDKKLIEMIYRTQELVKSAYAPMRDTIWRRDFLLYNNRHDPKMFGQAAKNYPLESAMFVPATYQQIESSGTDIGQGVLANEPGFTLASVIGASDYEEKSKYVEWSKRMRALLWTQLVKHVGLQGFAVPWARYCEIYGLLWLGVEWYKLMGVKWESRKQPDGDFKMVAVKGEILEDRIKVTPRSVFSMFPDPRGTTVNDSVDGKALRFLQERFTMSVDDFIQHVESTPLLEWNFTGPTEIRKTLEKYMGKVTSDDDIDRQLQRDIGHLANDTSNPPTDAEDKRIVAVTKHWEKDRVIWAVGDKSGDAHVCLRQIGSGDKAKHIDEYPYLNVGIPFVAMRTHPILGELFGVSEVEAGSGPQHQVNIMTNLRNSGIVRSMNNLTFINAVSDITPEMIKSQSSGVFRVPYGLDMDSIIKVIEWPDVTQGAPAEIDFWLQQHQMTIGRSNFSLGFSSPGFNETARGIGMMQGANQGRTNGKVAAMCQDIAKLAQMILKVDQRFMKTDQVVRVTGEDGTPDWLEISREMVARNYEITFDTRPGVANEQVQSQQLMQGLGIFGQWPELNRKAAIKRFFTLLQQHNPGELVNSESSDAHAENMKFMASGDFGPVGPDDDHKYHIKIHQTIPPEGITAKGDRGQLNYLNHIRRHLQFLNLISPASRDGQPLQDPEGMPLPQPPQGQGQGQSQGAPAGGPQGRPEPGPPPGMGGPQRGF
jgi:hypothetical protein